MLSSGSPAPFIGIASIQYVFVLWIGVVAATSREYILIVSQQQRVNGSELLSCPVLSDLYRGWCWCHELPFANRFAGVCCDCNAAIDERKGWKVKSTINGSVLFVRSSPRLPMLI